MRFRLALMTLLMTAALLPEGVRAQTCSADEVAKAVDDAGARLREFNAEAAPRLQAKLRQLKAKRGWSDAEYEEKSIDILHDSRIAELDRQANEILGRIDAPSNSTQAQVNCARLADLQAAGVELLATMRAKSAYMIQRTDALLEDRPVPTPSAPKTASKAPPPTVTPKTTPWLVPSPASPAGPGEKSPAWSTTTLSEPPPSGAPSPSPLSGRPGSDEGYTIDEIQEATRGFFGQISTSLASVIEHAFKHSGRPTAYVLGQEGGGAFLAGLRYGDGTMYLRAGGTQRIWWHGPSIGYDVGAAGSRTMFLIYNLKNPEDIHRRFTGIDGSAYLVGGVGITFLTNGEVVMAPIRSGIGLRLGASIGYVRFTPRPTWNPF